MASQVPVRKPTSSRPPTTQATRSRARGDGVAPGGVDGGVDGPPDLGADGDVGRREHAADHGQQVAEERLGSRA